MEKKSTMPAEGSELAYVNLLDIEISQTNKMFRDDSEMSESALENLIKSINAKGVIQPILLRPGVKGKSVYELVCGERRVRASGFAGKETIPAYIRQLNDDDALECQITENLQREDVNPIKEAQSFDWLTKNRKFTVEAISRKIGKSTDYVHERLRLVGLIKPLQDLVRSGDIPLKAGLKYAMIPKENQEDAMEETVDYIDLGEKKEKVLFAGLLKLQEWMDSHLFIDLQTADFDKEDPKLNAEMGPCSTCIFRTKNTGGLFDDITLVDECTKATCFRTKQINTYTKLKEDLKKKFPKAKIIFKKRSNSIEGSEIYRKHLVGEIKGAGAGTRCSEKEAQTNKGAELAILIGVSRGRYHNNFKSTEKYLWIKPSEMNRRSAGSVSVDKVKGVSPEQAEKNAKAEKKKELQDNVRDAYETQLKVRHILEQRNNDKLYASLLRDYIENQFYYSDTDLLVFAFQQLGLDWYEHGKPVKAKDFDPIAYRMSAGWRANNMSDADKKKSLANAKLNDLVALLFIAFYHESDDDNLFGIKRAEIDKKANSQMQSWWDKEQTRLAKPIGVPSEEARAKGVAALVGKKKVKSKKLGGGK